VATYGKHYLESYTGTDEFRKIIEILKERRQLPSFASANQKLWEMPLRDKDGKEYVSSVYSLSPSNYAKMASILDIGRYLPNQQEPKRCVIASTPNHAAVVLWVSIRDFNILLGSDLENINNPDTGWIAIVNSNERPPGRAKCFKIPHHGSRNAHSQAIWENMIDKEHVSILTPWIKGNKILPSRKDVNRICNLSNDSFSSAAIGSRRIKRDRPVEKTLGESDVDIRIANPYFGQVRERVDIKCNGEVELFFDAIPLRGMYN
jgi:hypothetical protein